MPYKQHNKLFVKNVSNDFAIPYIQYLNAQGELLKNHTISTTVLLQLYENILFTRLFDTKAIALQRTGMIGTFPASYGQEAIYAAAGLAMQSDDTYCPYYRDHGALFSRGVTVSDILYYWGGYGNIAHSSIYKNMPLSIPIASQCTYAVGIAYAKKYNHTRRAVICSIGDGATSKGDFYEAINFAGIHNLPIIFLVNNNQWAISTPLSKQTACKTIAQKAIAGNIDAIRVDGNDPIAMYTSISRALENCYAQNSPILIEACTYRLCDHTTADDKMRYMDSTQVELAQQNEPLIRFTKYLYAIDILSDTIQIQIQKKIHTQITQEISKFTLLAKEHFAS